MAEDNDPYPRQSLNNKDDVAYSWSNVWEWGTSLRAYRLANHGYKVENMRIDFINLHVDCIYATIHLFNPLFDKWIFPSFSFG